MGLFEEQFEELKKQYPSAENQNDGTGAILVKIPDFSLPTGWSKAKTNLFFKVPVGYPVAKPDCFWVDADLRLQNGNMPKNSGLQAIPPGQEQKLWFSWHINSWIPNQNNLKSYVAIIIKRLNIFE